MRRRSKLAALATLAIFAFGVCVWAVIVASNDLPPFEAGDIARRYAKEYGYDVSDSGTCGKFVAEPDAFGGCEVEVTFTLPPGDARGRELAIRLRRASVIADWQLTHIAARDQPDK